MRNLSHFWNLLETNFLLGGPRRHLRKLLGSDLVADLERADILRQQHVADFYPCSRLGGDNCPMPIVECDDGTIRATCGNEPAESRISS